MIPKLEKLRYEEQICQLSRFPCLTIILIELQCIVLQFQTAKVQLRSLTFIVNLMLQIFVIFELLLILLNPPVINLITILNVPVLKS